MPITIRSAAILAAVLALGAGPVLAQSSGAGGGGNGAQPGGVNPQSPQAGANSSPSARDMLGSRHSTQSNSPSNLGGAGPGIQSGNAVQRVPQAAKPAGQDAPASEVPRSDSAR